VTIRRLIQIMMLAAVALVPAAAGTIPVVSLSLSSDFPSSGLQEIAVTNDTGMTNGCNSTYLVCDTLAITNWTLTITYTSSYYNSAGGPSLASPYVATWQSSADNILPTASKLLDFDLCGLTDVADCAAPTTTISEIDFTGTLDQSSFAIYDASANGGAGGAGPTFFANPAISVVFTPTAGFPADYFESQDGSVADQNNAPEPATILLALSGLALARLGRRRP